MIGSDDIRRVIAQRVLFAHDPSVWEPVPD